MRNTATILLVCVSLIVLCLGHTVPKTSPPKAHHSLTIKNTTPTSTTSAGQPKKQQHLSIQHYDISTPEGLGSLDKDISAMSKAISTALKDVETVEEDWDRERALVQETHAIHTEYRNS